VDFEKTLYKGETLPNFILTFVKIAGDIFSEYSQDKSDDFLLKVLETSKYKKPYVKYMLENNTLQLPAWGSTDQ